MAGDSKKLQPIIIKRVKKGGHAAHGGAWKIAYADFVTAMMAFFLLMWLLGSTTDGDKKGIADFFNAPLKVSLMGGSGSGDSSSVVHGGGTDLSRSNGQVRDGDIPVKKKLLNMKSLEAEHKRAELAKLEDLKKKVEDVLDASPKLAAMKSQIRLDMTRDGLRIQIVDEQSRPMFDSGSAVVKPYMRELLREIGHVLSDVPNRITLEGHTDAQPFSGGERGYSNWELSSDRANASRRELVGGGLPEDHMLLVQGLASSNLFVPTEPQSAMNRRISIIVMNREAEDRTLKVQSEPAEVENARHRRSGDGGGEAPSTPVAPGRRRARRLDHAGVDRSGGGGRRRAARQAMTAPIDLPILVAEDNWISRELLVEQLRLLGRESVACEDGQQALEAWRTRRFAMLFTDLQMPVLDGFALASAIRAEDDRGRLPIVALSAADGEGDGQLDRCNAVGIDETVVEAGQPRHLAPHDRDLGTRTGLPAPAGHGGTSEGR